MLRLEDWQQLPYVTGEAAPVDKVRATLEAATRLRKLVESGFPPHIVQRVGPCDSTGNRFFAIAGDHYRTRGRFVVKAGRVVYEYLRGDETVLLRGAAFSNVERSFVSFSSHQTIFEDEHVQEALRRILLRCKLNFKDYKADSLSIELEPRMGGPRVIAPVYAMDAQVEPIVGRVGEDLVITANLDVETFHDVLAPNGKLTVAIDGEKILEESLKVTATGPASSAERTLFRFQSSKFAAGRKGLVVATVEFNTLQSFAAQALVLDDAQ
jgi:hypothetical protein